MQFDRRWRRGASLVAIRDGVKVCRTQAAAATRLAERVAAVESQEGPTGRRAGRGGFSHRATYGHDAIRHAGRFNGSSRKVVPLASGQPPPDNRSF